MKPVAILRFSGEDGPGYFASFLDRHSIPWQLFAIDAGDGVPADMAPFSGLVLMGVNPYYQGMFKGAILILAVAVDVIFSKKK